MNRTLTLLICIPALLATTFSFAATYPVAPGPGNSASNLRQAVINANNNSGPDTIQLSAGTYQLKQTGKGEDSAATGDLDILEDVTIQGAGVDATTVDGNDLDRVFHVISGGGSVSVTFTNVTIRNGSPGTAAGQVGGCLKSDGADVTLSNVRILDGLAYAGGGIYSLGGTLVLRSCLIQGNIADAGLSGQGGGIFFRETTSEKLQITDSILKDNAASDDGGGIENYEGTIEIVRSTIIGNSSGDDGGAIENDNHESGGFLTVMDSAIVSNTAMNGGGIDNDGFLLMVNSTVTGNRATNVAEEAWGSGGIRNSEDTIAGIQVALTNCTVYGNQAVIDSGLTLKAGDIGNISLVASEVRLLNTILGTCLSHVTAGEHGTFVSEGNNVIQDSSGCQLSLAPGASPDISGDPKVDPLSDDDTAGNAHLPLQSGSPAIDAADAAGAPALDQLGQTRVDGDGDTNVEPDIGALEFEGILSSGITRPTGLRVLPFPQ